MTPEEQFKEDHKAGNQVLTASRWPSLVVPQRYRPEWMPSPLALALHMRGDVPLEAEGDHLEMGHDMEPAAARRLKRLDPPIMLWRTQPRYEEPAIPALCYPDALTCDGRLVEIKTVIGGDHAYETRWGAGVPLHVKVQAQAQMLISGVEVCLVVPVIIGYAAIRIEVFELESDPAIQNVLFEAAQEFMNILAAGDLPQPDASESSYRALLKTTTLAKGKSVLLPGSEWVDLAAAWRCGKEIEKKYREASESARNQFASVMGDAEEAVLDDGSIVKRSLVKPSTYTVERKESWRWNV